MKTLKVFPIISLCLAFAGMGFAQAKTETLKVSGECGMCKKKIEKAAKEAGASYALWNMDSKILTIKYNKASTNTAKIEKKIAGVGYDTPDFKATEEAYKKLDDCCQYEREGVTKASSDKMDCSKKDANGKMDCCKKDADGKTAANCKDGDSGCCSKKIKTQQ